MVGQLPVVHDLEEDVEKIRMRLLDLVEQQDHVRVLVGRVGEQTALVEADIARRRADQTRYRMPLHVLAHVEADEGDAENMGELPRHFGLADARRPAEQVAADRLVRLAQPRARHLDRGGDRGDGFVLTEHDGLQVALQSLQGRLVAAADVLGRDAGDLGHHAFDVLDADGLAPLRFRQQAPGGADLVDHVDRLVGELAVVDVAVGELDGGADRLRRVADAVVFLVAGLEAAQDADRLVDARLVHVDLLEAPGQCAVLLEVVTVFLVGGRADAAQGPALQRRLEQVGGVHRPAAGGARADHRVNLVDEQDRAVMGFDLGQHGLDALLEIAAVAGARQQHAHVEGEDHGIREDLRHFVAHDAPRQALRQRRLSDSRVADVERVVLGAAAEDLDRAFDLSVAADQRVDPAGLGLGVQIDAPSFQRARPFLGDRLLRAVFVRVGDGTARRRPPRHLGDPVRDVVDGVVARHVLPLEEIDRVRFAFGEDRDQDVRASDLGAARGLHVEHGALDHPLEARRRPRFDRRLAREAVESLFEEAFEIAGQSLDVHAARLEHGDGVGITGEREQQMFERREFVPPLGGHGERPAQALFEIGREHRYSFSIVHCSGCSLRRAKSVTWPTLVSATS